MIYVNDARGCWDAERSAHVSRALAARGGDVVARVAPAAGDRFLFEFYEREVLPEFAWRPVFRKQRSATHRRMNSHIAEVPNPEPPPHPQPTDPPPTAVNEDEVKEREQEKLDIGDSHPEDRDIRPKPTRQGDGLDVGDPHPADRDTEPRT